MDRPDDNGALCKSLAREVEVMVTEPCSVMWQNGANFVRQKNREAATVTKGSLTDRLYNEYRLRPHAPAIATADKAIT